MQRDAQHVADMATACQRILEYTSGLDRDGLVRSRMVQDAVIRQIMILGEATKRLSPEFRDEHDAIPWADIAGMRDVLVHRYDVIDLGELWLVVARDVPDLMTQLNRLLASD